MRMFVFFCACALESSLSAPAVATLPLLRTEHADKVSVIVDAEAEAVVTDQKTEINEQPRPKSIKDAGSAAAPVAKEHPRPAAMPEVSVLVFLASVGLGIVVLATTSVGANMPKSVMGLCACAVYVFISVTIDLSILLQKSSSAAAGGQSTHTYTFEPTVAVMLTETSKLAISGVIYSFVQLSSPSSSSLGFSSLTLTDVLWLCVPAMLYTLNNVLVWWAIGKNDASTFGVLRDTMVLWTALLWRTTFNTPLGYVRLSAIALIFIGCVINQLWSFLANSTALSLSALLVLAMTFCNALGSVANEIAMKRRPEVDINIQNIVLYSFCALFTVPLIVLSGSLQNLREHGLFTGFTRHACFTVMMQVIAGLFVSRILKYADAVMKNIAASLRGPILVFLSTFFMATKHDISTYVSVAFVFTGCATYLLQGPLQIKPVHEAREAPQKGV